MRTKKLTIILLILCSLLTSTGCTKSKAPKPEELPNAVINISFDATVLPLHIEAIELFLYSPEVLKEAVKEVILSTFEASLVSIL